MSGRYALWAVFCWILVGITPAFAHTPGFCDNASLSSTLDDSDLPPDFTHFGAAVAISGYTAMVGLPGYASSGDGPRQLGRVAIFTCDPEMGTWSRTGSLDPQDQAEGEVGFGGEIEMDGRQAIVSASNTIRIYEDRHGNWRQVLKLTSNGIDEFIGADIAFDSPHLAIRRDRIVAEQSKRFVDIYRVDKRARLVARLDPPDDGFAPLALDNETLLVGLNVYTRHRGKWRLRQQLVPDVDPPPGSDFGAAVAIRRNTVLVGSPREGMMIGDDGAYGGGAVYVFERRKYGWKQVQRIRPEGVSFNAFGATLALNERYAAIGAPEMHGQFQHEFGPTFLYRINPGGLVFDRAFEAVATSIDMSRRHLIIGTHWSSRGLPTTGASILRLPLLHAAAQSVEEDEEKRDEGFDEEHEEGIEEALEEEIADE